MEALQQSVLSSRVQLDAAWGLGQVVDEKMGLAETADDARPVLEEHLLTR